MSWEGEKNIRSLPLGLSSFVKSEKLIHFTRSTPLKVLKEIKNEIWLTLDRRQNGPHQGLGCQKMPMNQVISAKTHTLLSLLPLSALTEESIRSNKR